MAHRKVLIAALALMLAGCSKPQAVLDLKSGIAALADAGAKAVISQDGYHQLVSKAQAQFAAAKPLLSSSASAPCQAALDRVADVDLIWRDTYDIADGLTPVVEAPLTRLNVVKSHKDFEKWEAGFIPWQQDEEDAPADGDYKEKVREGGRHDLLKQAMDGAAPTLQGCATAL
jgi:hypothetical protein